MPLWTCTAPGDCTKESKSVSLDANWRWIHDETYTNCYKNSEWLGPCSTEDGVSCAKNCYLAGNDVKDYETKYGIFTDDHGIKLDFATGQNYGSRVYMMDDDDNYELFYLKNREFTLTVDMKDMPCGLNGAVYFVEMDKAGGKGKYPDNKAGAKYGTGYCDAQCPHDIKFVNGEANIKGWKPENNPPVGEYGICCAELDIWEANSQATAYTTHPCEKEGAYRCSGTECGDNDSDERYAGICDKDGCDFNSWRHGNHSFYGRHDFTLDSTRELTVVTQFITDNGEDDGNLVEVKRFYVQDGKVVPNSESSIGAAGNSLTDDFCVAQKSGFGDTDDHTKKGGLANMGKALDRGMVLVFSIWDDSMANMLWLDAVYPADGDKKTPGVWRGPCSATSGKPDHVRSHYGDAYVRYTNVKVGPIGSTFGAQETEQDDDDRFGDLGRRLGALHV